jgi:hypothetical protein
MLWTTGTRTGPTGENPGVPHDRSYQVWTTGQPVEDDVPGDLRRHRVVPNPQRLQLQQQDLELLLSAGIAVRSAVLKESG